MPLYKKILKNIEKIIKILIRPKENIENLNF